MLEIECFEKERSGRERAETFIAAIYGAAQPEALFPFFKRNCKRG